jgi:hypothetical protein
MNKGSEETINLQLVLTSELRKLLDNQHAIRLESEISIKEMPFYEFETFMSITIITRHIFELLFDQYPQFKKIKDKLIVSTFRTGLIKPYGLNGETNYHRDNILFPGNCDRNLIVTWGPGTEALSLSDSIKWTTIRDQIMEQMWTIEDIGEQDRFIEMHDHIISVEKHILNNKLNVMKSSSPDINGNINALIMSGKKVLHRREPVDDAVVNKKYRYVLNIYFNSNDLE